MYYSTTSFSGESPEWLWDEFKQVPPGDQNGNERHICAIAVYVALFRYEFLSEETQEMLDEILRAQVPSPGSHPGGRAAEVLLNEFEELGGNA